jgi:cell filamentation protein
LDQVLPNKISDISRSEPMSTNHHKIIHGKSRVARLLAIVMATQAGLPPLDFGNLKGHKRRNYFRAVQAGMDYKYCPMEEIFDGVIETTLSDG